MAEILRSGEMERGERKTAELNAPAELAPADVSPESGAPSDPELLLRVARIRSALADLAPVKYEGSSLTGLLIFLFIVLLIWLPPLLKTSGLPFVSLLDWTSELLRRASDNDDVFPSMLAAAVLFLPFLLPLLLTSWILAALGRHYARRINDSGLAADFVCGRLDVNDVVRAAHPRFARWHGLQSARYVDEEVALLFKEVNWFLAPRQKYWRMAWLYSPASRVFLVSLVVLLFSGLLMTWPWLVNAVAAQPWLDYALVFLVFTPYLLTGLLLATVYPMHIWRDLHWRAWHAPLRKAIMTELDRLDPPTPRPPHPYEVHTISSLLGLRRPELVDPSRPREEPNTENRPSAELHGSLARRLRFSPTTGVEANPALPWAVWAAPNALWLLSWIATTFDPALAPSVLTNPETAVPLMCGFSAFILLPLGLVIWEARLEQLAVRRYLQQASPELRLAAALDTRHNSDSKAGGSKIVVGRSQGTLEEGLQNVARELGTELKQWPHLRLPLPSALICLLLATICGLLPLLLQNPPFTQELDLWLCLLPVTLTLCFVPASYRRRMILDELTEYMQRSLAWDGEESAADM